MKREHELFEQDWARFCGLTPECVVACSSGTAALHLALECCKCDPKRNLVYMPDYTMVACARAAVLAGFTPVFCDVDAHTGLMPAAHLATEQHNLSRTAAVIVPHIYGRRVNISAIRDVVGEHVFIVEDLAEAHGVQPSRSSDFACWSFYKNKIVAGEEGGALASRFHDMRNARLLRSLGFTEAHDYTHIPYGHNYRMADLLAAPIRKSISAHFANYAWRRAQERLHDNYCPTQWQMPYRDTVWVYDLRIPGMSSKEQEDAVRMLRTAGHEVRYGFKPMSSLEEFMRPHNNHNSYALSREVLYFPLDCAETVGSIQSKFSILKQLLWRYL